MFKLGTHPEGQAQDLIRRRPAEAERDYTSSRRSDYSLVKEHRLFESNQLTAGRFVVSRGLFYLAGRG